ncbi:MAG: 16S rRNA (guanine(966)-N(2))-methyltransferase RsmD [Clostridia bacterium]|nr:16S rRNA (guanine(966)-N(2))-methyltransferase RsmD [Clostridia bacterium]
MRIITGSARGIALDAPEGMETRPTTDRVKEALFSMIQFDIEGRRVLDLFAGSGQLGLEALSRGAASATFIDSSRQAQDVILKNAAKTKLKERATVALYDFSTFLEGRRSDEKFDIIFLDPPYGSGHMTTALRLIASSGVLREGGYIACETDTEIEERRRGKKKSERDDASDVLCDVFGGDEELSSRFELIRSARYGRSRITLLTIPKGV